jgi:hypothetical protein
MILLCLLLFMIKKCEKRDLPFLAGLITTVANDAAHGAQLNTATRLFLAFVAKLSYRSMEMPPKVPTNIKHTNKHQSQLVRLSVVWSCCHEPETKIVAICKKKDICAKKRLLPCNQPIEPWHSAPLGHTRTSVCPNLHQ